MVLRFLRRWFTRSTKPSRSNRTNGARWTCPHCAAPIPDLTPPARRCPECNGSIYLRALPNDPRKRFVTKAQAEAIDQEWTAARADPAAMLAQRITLLEQQGDAQALVLACVQLAQCYVGRDRDQVERLLAKAAWHELAQRENGGATQVRIRAAKDCCEDCWQLHDRVIAISTARDERPIPCRRCLQTLGWCWAVYVPA